MSTYVESENEMEKYEPESDPRENAQEAAPMVTGEAPWLLQVSLKTPAGALINVRGMSSWDIAVGLDAIQGLAHQIKDTEAALGVAQAVAPIRQMPQQQPQPQPQQQAPQWGQQPPPQQQQQPQGGPVCNCGYPARFVPGGISKKTNKPYRAFYACGNPVRDAECNFRANG